MLNSTMPAVLRQQWWVLATASANHPVQPADPEESAALQLWQQLEPIHRLLHGEARPGALQQLKRLRRRHPSDLWFFRYLLDQAPELLEQEAPVRLYPSPRSARIAVVIPGALRCLERNAAWLRQLNRRVDCFICTTAADKAAAMELRGGRTLQVCAIEDQANWQAADQALPVNSMRQWLKMQICLEMVQAHEQQLGQRYTHLIKLRTDYLHCNPRALLQEVARLEDGLGMASDKVFAGPRALMLQLQGFYRSLRLHTAGRVEAWPICVEQILRSDDAGKWMGFGFPERLVGQPGSVAALRAQLEQGGAALAEALGQGEAGSVRFFAGDQRFASEVAFARFLNLAGIPWRSLPSLHGQLLPQRHGR